MTAPLSEQQQQRMHAYWRASNYLSVGQIYLQDNPLLDRPLTLDDVKPRLIGHWGTTSGLNFIYTHLNRLITERDLALPPQRLIPAHLNPGPSGGQALAALLAAPSDDVAAVLRRHPL